MYGDWPCGLSCSDLLCTVGRGVCRSVLENHHVASAWALILENPENNFLKRMEPADRRRLHDLVIECVLATDLAKHGAVLKTFSSQVGYGRRYGVPADTPITINVPS